MAKKSKKARSSVASDIQILARHVERGAGSKWGLVAVSALLANAMLLLVAFVGTQFEKGLNPNVGMHSFLGVLPVLIPVSVGLALSIAAFYATYRMSRKD